MYPRRVRGKRFANGDGRRVSRLLGGLLFCLPLLLPTLAGAEVNRHAEGSLRNEIALGVVPEQNIFRQIERYTPIARYLSTVVGRNVTLKVFTVYQDAIDALDSAGIDGVFLGSLASAVAVQEKAAVPLARPEYMDGSSTYHGLLFVRKDSGIRDARGMKGTRFVFVSRATTAGYVLPLFYFRTHGIKDYTTYFKETYFAGTHEGAITDVLDGRADVGAAKNTIYRRLAAEDTRVAEELKILSRSPDVPETTLVVRSNLNPSVSAALGDALLAMHRNPAGSSALKDFGARRFISAAQKDYEPLIAYVRKAGLDLRRYAATNGQ